jgi:hypothetical protein
VVNPYTRHPALVARGAATVAEVTGGRFVLAYGAGNRRELLDRLGDLAVRARVDRARLSLNHRDPDDVRSGLTLEKMGLAGSPVGAWSRFATEGSGD